MSECLKQLMMSLLRAYRFSPIIPDLGFQVRNPVIALMQIHFPSCCNVILRVIGAENDRTADRKEKGKHSFRGA